MSKQKQQSKKIAEVVDGFGQLEARQQTIHQWTVLSYRNNSVTAHTVNTWDRECTCEDMQYNQDGSEVCDHLAVALHYDSRQMDVGTALNFDLQQRIADVTEVAERIEQQATALDADMAASDTVDTYEEVKEETEDTDTETEDTGGTTEAAQEAADRLRSAFDEHLDDMQVEASGDAVFFQTGHDTSEDWPYPGGSETFKVLTEPELVKYVHDGTADWADNPHPLYDDKPGEWYKNAIDPEAVEDYIDTVLA